MATLEDRVGRIERKIYVLTGGSIVAILAIGLYFGVTPEKIANEVESEVQNYLTTEKKNQIDMALNSAQELNNLFQPLYVQHGSEDMRKEMTSWEETFNDGNVVYRRGLRDEPVTFTEPFQSKPQVIMGLSGIDMRAKAKFDKDKGYVEVGNNRIRVVVDPSDIDRYGFRYSFYSWADTEIASAQAFWIAVGQREVPQRSSE